MSLKRSWIAKRTSDVEEQPWPVPDAENAKALGTLWRYHGRPDVKRASVTKHSSSRLIGTFNGNVVRGAMSITSTFAGLLLLYLGFGTSSSTVSADEEWDQERMNRIAPRCEGAEIIYREPPLFLHARVGRITRTRHGVEVDIIPLGTPGFPEFHPFTMGACWGQRFSFSEKKWHVMYANRTLFFEPDAISDAIKVAPTATCGSREWLRLMIKTANYHSLKARMQP